MIAFTEKDLKRAFWRTFHRGGEIFFDYLSSEEENNKSTEYWWNEFIENLFKELQNEQRTTTDSS